VVVRDSDLLQYRVSADYVMGAQVADEYCFHVPDLDHCEYGMWFERFVIVVTSLYRDFLPSSWGTYRATKWDYMTYVVRWACYGAVPAVCALPAHDSHERNQDDAAGGEDTPKKQ